MIKDYLAFYKESWELARKHKKGFIFSIILTYIIAIIYYVIAYKLINNDDEFEDEETETCESDTTMV